MSKALKIIDRMVEKVVEEVEPTALSLLEDFFEQQEEIAAIYEEMGGEVAYIENVFSDVLEGNDLDDDLDKLAEELEEIFS